VYFFTAFFTVWDHMIWLSGVSKLIKTCGTQKESQSYPAYIHILRLLQYIPGQGEGRSRIDEIERQIEREQEVSHLPQAEARWISYTELRKLKLFKP
jgi:hypothetical protein